MYYKELFVFNNHKPVKATIRTYQMSDFDQLIEVQKEAFPPPFPSELWWNVEQLSNHVHFFPEGALCVEIDGIIVGSITGLLTNFDIKNPNHTWSEVTDNGYIRNHNPKGNSLYIVDICVRPTYRNLQLGKWLMHSMYETVVQLNLDRLIGGGRMPGFHKHSNELDVEQYIEKIVSGELKDPVITFLLRCGRTPLLPIPNYLEDEDSLHYALLMEWKNPFKQLKDHLT